MEKSNSTNSKMDHIGGVTIKVKNSSIKKKENRNLIKIFNSNIINTSYSG